ncbi:MAG: hypothetical protein CMJ02_03190 [Pelagibacteraceae bacterium]|nr:hypothetical protein [Pelagibacteraceae bacterium]OUV88815.1 MAG: hypothetical protein CBD06_02975 [Pelagibacteraceae bacterium TMED146]
MKQTLLDFCPFLNFYFFLFKKANSSSLYGHMKSPKFKFQNQVIEFAFKQKVLCSQYGGLKW